MTNSLSQLYKICGALFIIWTLLVVYETQADISAVKKQTISLAKSEAITTFNKDQAVRFWASQHGGVYVPITEKTPANKFLSHIPDRDITTASGKKLTLMNPAYMIRQIMEDYEALYGTKGRITSLKYLNPANKPDQWETKALKAFENDGKKEFLEVVHEGPESYLRLMRPMVTEGSCLKCHGFQGYKVGDIRGGVGVKLSLEPYLALEKEAINNVISTHLRFWGVGTLSLIMFIFWGRRRVNDQINTQEKLVATNHELTKALDEIKTLRGIIPICSYCKKIRDDNGDWKQLEDYIYSHTDARFSHGACPDCYEKQVEDMNK